MHVKIPGLALTYSTTGSFKGLLYRDRMEVSCFSRLQQEGSPVPETQDSPKFPQAPRLVLMLLDSPRILALIVKAPISP